jgi:hypothetical protein
MEVHAHASILDLPNKLSSSHLQHRGRQLLLQEQVRLIEMWRMGFIDSNIALKISHNDLIWIDIRIDRMRMGKDLTPCIL